MRALITEFIHLRKELGITQRQLEKLSGVSLSRESKAAKICQI